jgi:hypothetical protein
MEEENKKVSGQTLFIVGYELPWKLMCYIGAKGERL